MTKVFLVVWIGVAVIWELMALLTGGQTVSGVVWNLPTWIRWAIFLSIVFLAYHWFFHLISLIR